MSFSVVFHNCSEDLQHEVNEQILRFQSDDFELEVRSSGSTGTPKTILHPKADVIASARRTNAFFGLNSNSKVLCPLAFTTIGGKMTLFRAIVGDYEVHFVPPGRGFIHQLPNGFRYNLVSLAPIQLEALLEGVEEGNFNQDIYRFQTILLGGSAISKELEQKAMQLKIVAFLGFGMTETVSHIALRLLGEEHYTVLPGISVVETEQGIRILFDDTGKTVDATDRIELLRENRFKWLGRNDFVINSGGVKIHPESLEALLSKYISQPCVVVGIPDPTYGEVAVLVTESPLKEPEQEVIKAQITEHFGKYAVPKQFFVHSFYYINGLKIDRRRLKTVLQGVHE